MSLFSVGIGTTKEKKEKDRRMDHDYGELFKAFCSSSTVHGTHFWSNGDNIFLRVLWMGIVLCGILSSAYIINKSFMAWKQNPVITAVAQIPIEQVPFPSVTICPLGNTKFGYPELVANEKGLPKAEIGRALGELLLLITINSPIPENTNCLSKYCSNKENTDNCHNQDKFKQHLEASNYAEMLKKKIISTFPHELKVEPALLKIVEVNANSSCREKARDFLLLEEFTSLMSDFKLEMVQPGSLLKMLYINLATKAKKTEMFLSFFKTSQFPELYSSSLGATKDHNNPIPNLVEMLAEVESFDATTTTSNNNNNKNNNINNNNLDDLTYSAELMKVMRLSLHPPYVAEDRGGGSIDRIPNPAFPFCFYQDRQQDGLQYGPYKEFYCQDFQTTMNEKGLCYTYNNYNLGTDPNLRSDETITIRQVKGCGKSKGLQLVVDSQKLANQPAFNGTASKGFIIYVTVPGVVTHKVPFTIDPSFSGEHHFTFHGIHFIDSSEEFKAWNKDAKACYFPKDKNMSYFSFYTQDNCLLECRYNKIAAKCGCAPWYLNQTKLSICGTTGNTCFNDQFNNYQDELQDRADCDCRSDCEGIHIFASMNRYPFTDTTTTDAHFWYNDEEKKGRLANYLLDPLDIFTDGFTKNLSMLAHNVSSNTKWAAKRFRDDISILNFYFDTPIITRITLEMRITVFDQIAAIGGSLGLFTGVSLITFLEIFYWGVKFVLVGLKKAGSAGMPRVKDEVMPVQESRIGPEFSKAYYTFNS